jgi:glutamate dehydrogenase (NAD(P)+)
MGNRLETELSTAGPENAEVTPEAVHTFFREDGRILGHLVVDSTIHGLSVGGIRMVPELPLQDLCHLARVMTLKYSFLKWPFGGAKAAILTHCDDPSPEQRRQDLESFARRLAAFRGRYLPGQDIGTNRDDLNLIRRIARLERVQRVPDSAYYTALTVRICVEHLARAQGLHLPQCAVAIEGLGKVGGWAVRHLGELGCRVVAVSTSKGAVYRRDGLDVGQLLRAREAVGDECVNQYEASCRVEREQLLSLPVDILVPCALSWSIRTANAGAVRAKLVVCGANNAVTDRAKEVLAARGIVYFPDFVSNCGGVLGSAIEMLCRDRRRATDLLRQQVEPRVSNVLAEACRTGRSLETTAREIALANYQEMRQRQATTASKLSALLARAYRHGLLPRPAVRLFAATYVRKTMA